MDDSFFIRPAAAEDCPEIAAMLAELAAHHGERASVTADDLRRIAFGPGAVLRFLVASFSSPAFAAPPLSSPLAGGRSPVNPLPPVKGGGREGGKARIKEGGKSAKITLVGFSALRLWPDLRTSETLCEIDALHVRFRARRRGIGRALIRASAREARKAGASGVRLGVRAENWGARAFYMKTGFVEKPPSGIRCALDGSAFDALAEDEYWPEAA